MSIRRVALLVTSAVALLTCPAVALGQSVPPGSSELDQYVGQQGNGSASGSSTTSDSKQPHYSVSTGPQTESDRNSAHFGKGAGKSPVGATIDTLSGEPTDGGMGILLPLFLAATLAMGIVYALRRRRSVGD
jgi:uncharacterized membrane protein